MALRTASPALMFPIWTKPFGVNTFEYSGCALPVPGAPKYTAWCPESNGETYFLPLRFFSCLSNSIFAAISRTFCFTSSNPISCSRSLLGFFEPGCVNFFNATEPMMRSISAVFCRSIASRSFCESFVYVFLVD